MARFSLSSFPFAIVAYSFPTLGVQTVADVPVAAPYVQLQPAVEPARNDSIHTEKPPLFLRLNAPQPHLVDDTPTIRPDEGLPKNWRTTADLRTLNEASEVNTLGLELLNISGSGAFGEGQFREILRLLAGLEVVVIDLREEPHGYLDNLAVGWYAPNNAFNHGRTDEEIEVDETQRLLQTMGETELFVLAQTHLTHVEEWQTRAIPYVVKRVRTERELVTQHGPEYVRINYGDHRSPPPWVVDAFMAEIKKRPPHVWKHVHCAAGVGRTTTMMIILDMMLNAHRVPAKDIIKRQILLGGVKYVSENTNAKQAKWAKKREDFLHLFYEYARTQAPVFEISWSQWLAAKK